MIINNGPIGSAKFDPLKNIILSSSDTEYDILVNGNIWEIALKTSGSIKFKNLKNTTVKIFLIGQGSSGGASGYYAGQGGNGGKYIYNSSFILQPNFLYNFIIGGDIGVNENTIFYNLDSSTGQSTGTGGRGGTAQGSPPNESLLNGGNGTTGIYAFGGINNSLIYPTTQFGGGGGGGAYGDYGEYWSQGQQYSWSATGSSGTGGKDGGGTGGKAYSLAGGSSSGSKSNGSNGTKNSGGGGGGRGVSFCITNPNSYSGISDSTSAGSGGSGIILIQGIIK